MCIPINKKEYIYSRWDSTTEDTKRLIFNEFRMKHRGYYTEKAFLCFLEKKLILDNLHPSGTSLKATGPSGSAS